MFSPLSRIALVLLLTGLGLVACNDDKPADGEPRSKDSASTQTAVVRSDSGTTPSLPPLAPPSPPELGADTIPLHGPNGEQTRYGIETGHIVLRYTGDSYGERRITFDSYGLRERREERTRPSREGKSGMLNAIIMITTPEEHAYADIQTKQGWKTRNEGFQRYLASGAGKTMSLGAMILNEAGAEVLPDTIINGYHCKVRRKQVKGMTVTNWLWRGIMIREHLVSPSDTVQYTLEPVEITANIDVPDSTFRFPAGYKIVEYDGKDER